MPVGALWVVGLDLCHSLAMGFYLGVVWKGVGLVNCLAQCYSWACFGLAVSTGLLFSLAIICTFLFSFALSGVGSWDLFN